MCFVPAFWPDLHFWLKAKHDVLDIRNWSQSPFGVRFYVTLSTGWAVFFFLNFFLSLFILRDREKERERTSRRGAKRGGDRIRSAICADSSESNGDLELTNREIMYLSWSQMLNRLDHPGAPNSDFISTDYIFSDSVQRLRSHSEILRLECQHFFWEDTVQLVEWVKKWDNACKITFDLWLMLCAKVLLP